MPKRNCASMLTLFWPEFTVLGLSPTASRDHLEFTHDITQVLSHADFVQRTRRSGNYFFPVCRSGYLTLYFPEQA
jgi:hypothetical protein